MRKQGQNEQNCSLRGFVCDYIARKYSVTDCSHKKQKVGFNITYVSFGKLFQSPLLKLILIFHLNVQLPYCNILIYIVYSS